MPNYSQKDYQLVADLLKDLPSAFSEGYWGMANVSFDEYIALQAIEIFSEDSPKFKTKLFLQACGFEHPRIEFLSDPTLEESMGRHFIKDELKSDWIDYHTDKFPTFDAYMANREKEAREDAEEEARINALNAAQEKSNQNQAPLSH